MGNTHRESIWLYHEDVLPPNPPRFKSSSPRDASYVGCHSSHTSFANVNDPNAPLRIW